jgi:hypothetical protein
LAREPELRQALGTAGHARVKERYADTVVLPLLNSIYDETRRPTELGKESELMTARIGK